MAGLVCSNGTQPLTNYMLPTVLGEEMPFVTSQWHYSPSPKAVTATPGGGRLNCRPPQGSVGYSRRQKCETVIPDSVEENTAFQYIYIYKYIYISCWEIKHIHTHSAFKGGKNQQSNRNSCVLITAKVTFAKVHACLFTVSGLHWVSLRHFFIFLF